MYDKEFQDNISYLFLQYAAQREISRSPRLAHKAPVMQAIIVVASQFVTVIYTLTILLFFKVELVIISSA